MPVFSLQWVPRKTQKLLSLPKKITIPELLFLIPSLIINLGFLYQTNFVKMGIPLHLPNFMGGVPNQQVSLFVFETYLIYIACLLFIFFRKKKVVSILQSPLNHKLWWATCFFVCYGMFRLAINIAENPIQAIRNSAFIWYLSIPLMLYILPIRKKIFEIFAWTTLSFTMFLFILSWIDRYLCLIPKIKWLPTIGIYAFFALALTHSKKRIYLPILTIIGLALSIDSFYGFSRTNLLGLLATLGIVLFFNKINYRQCLIRLSILLIVFTVGRVSWFSWEHSVYQNNWQQKIYIYCLLRSVVDPAFRPTLSSAAIQGHDTNFYIGKFRINFVDNLAALYRRPQNRNPFSKSELDIYGVDKFRNYMWKDAWNLFLEKPVFGIGFQKQVVYRIYQGTSAEKKELIFFTNDQIGLGNTPPIAGPHNSYLNALARIGILGLFIVFLHLYALFILIVNKNLTGCFYLFLGQVLYATVNVGLEGPVGSAGLLIILTPVLKLQLPPYYQEQLEKLYEKILLLVKSWLPESAPIYNKESANAATIEASVNQPQ